MSMGINEDSLTAVNIFTMGNFIAWHSTFKMLYVYRFISFLFFIFYSVILNEAINFRMNGSFYNFYTLWRKLS